MKYEYSLIHISDTPESSETMYSILCLNASQLVIQLNDMQCYLDGKYLLCLSQDDRLSVISGKTEALNLHFQLCFYNVNLNHTVVGLSTYEDMRSRFGYPDFHLFNRRDTYYIGILPLNDEEYTILRRCIISADGYIQNHKMDPMWSCRTRSEIISILRVAEGIYYGDKACTGSEILCYIREHIGEKITLPMLCQRFNTNRTTLASLIKEQTGMSPIQYVLEERLNQSRPELLFTMMPIQELAEKYGFEDVNYYIRAFRKRFGITPLQYRREGQAERICNASNYHQKEQVKMTVSDFCEYVEKGLGRAILLLRDEPNKKPYRKVLVEYYTKNTFFSRLGSSYDAELIRCFDDFEALSAEIAVSLLDSIKDGSKLAMIPMLIELGYREIVTAIIEFLYSRSYHELLEYTKNGNARDDTPACVSQYFSAVSGLGYLKVTRERMKKALLDMADLYHYSSKPEIPEVQNPLFTAGNAYGFSEIKTLAYEVADEHPYGANILKIHLLDFDTPQYAITADQIFAAYRPGDTLDMDLHIAFVHADIEVRMAVAEEILRENDMDRRVFLMQSFCDPMPNFSQAGFPLDPSPLIEIAQALPLVTREENVRENGIVTTFYSFLSKVHHPAVKELGKKILADPKADFFQRDQAAKMVFAANFAPEDTPAFLAYLQENDHESIVCAALDADAPLPEEVIEFAFVNKKGRISLVKKLLEKGKLYPSLREECSYDSNVHIRNLVKNS